MQTTSAPAPAVELRQLAGLIIEYANSSEVNLAALVKPHDFKARDIEAIAKGQYDELHCEDILARVKAICASIGGDADASDPLYEEMSTAKAVRGSFTRLLFSKTKAKLVIVEGDTGMGKTSAGEIILRKMRDLNAVASIHEIEASAAWKGRPGPMMTAMLMALGMPDNSRSDAAKQNKLITALNQRPTTFILDEMHDGGVDMLRTLKTLLNRTTVKLVFLAHPKLFRDLENASWDDVKQLTGNRLLSRVDLGSVTEPDVQLMLTKRLPSLNGCASDAATALTKAAHGNGNFALVREVIARLQKLAAKDASQAITMTEVDKALRAELRDRKALSLSR